MGAAYLLWLAWRIATAAPATPGATARGRPLGLVGAALFQWVNPKAWTIAAGAAVTYAGGTGERVPQTLLLVAIFVVTTLVTLVGWALLGAAAARLLRAPGALRAFNLAMAALLVASLVPMLAG